MPTMGEQKKPHKSEAKCKIAKTGFYLGKTIKNQLIKFAGDICGIR